LPVRCFPGKFAAQPEHPLSRNNNQSHCTGLHQLDRY